MKKAERLQNQQEKAMQEKGVADSPTTKAQPHIQNVPPTPPYIATPAQPA